MNLKHLGQIADSDRNSETPLFSEYVQVGPSRGFLAIGEDFGWSQNQT